MPELQFLNFFPNFRTPKPHKSTLQSNFDNPGCTNLRKSLLNAMISLTSLTHCSFPMEWILDTTYPEFHNTESHQILKNFQKEILDET